MAEPNPELNLGLTDEQIAQLGWIFRNDRNLARAGSTDTIGDDLVAALARMDVPLVYTAFDGDHFELTPQMRAWVLKRGWVPANPENIVGYKDSVDAHKTKAGVLLDDLAIVDRCDRLCVFTDVEADPRPAMAQLAEGVIIELLHFLRRRVKSRRLPQVLFVPTANLFGVYRPAVEYKATFKETYDRLAADQSRLKVFLNNVWDETTPLPKVAYIAHDPLDAKYVHWLRMYGYQETVVPLVATLALSLADTEVLGHRQRAMGRLLAARCRLLGLADEVWMLAAQDLRNGASSANRLLEKLCAATDRPTKWITWEKVNVPKAVDPGWALSERETPVPTYLPPVDVIPPVEVIAAAAPTAGAAMAGAAQGG